MWDKENNIDTPKRKRDEDDLGSLNLGEFEASSSNSEEATYVTS